MSYYVSVHCYAELNDFLPPARRDRPFDAPLAGHETVKDLLESQGVPHPEIAALQVNGVSVDFDARLQAGDLIEVYPAMDRLEQPVVPLRPPLATLRFVADNHLGRLAAYLRMLGFDTLYHNDYDDRELARLSAEQARILLTRDLGLLKRNIVTYGYYVRSLQPIQQLAELVRRFHLAKTAAPFQRCIRCNGLLSPVDKSTIQPLLEPKTQQYYDTFFRCQDCGQIYWPGSHYQRMNDLIVRVLAESVSS